MVFTNLKPHILKSIYFLILDSASVKCCGRLFYKSDHKYCSKCKKNALKLVEWFLQEEGDRYYSRLWRRKVNSRTPTLVPKRDPAFVFWHLVLLLSSICCWYSKQKCLLHFFVHSLDKDSTWRHWRFYRGAEGTIAHRTLRFRLNTPSLALDRNFVTTMN